MSQASNQTTALPREDAPPGVGSRAFALTALVGTAGAMLWLAVAIVRIFTDSWIAPIALSPDSDAVLSMNLELTRQTAEIERVQGEMARIDAEIEAIDGGLERLRTLRDASAAVFQYGADTSGEEEGSLGRSLRELHEERAILDRLIARQRAETDRSREHLASGLIERRDLELQEQALDSLELQRIGNIRSTEAAELQHHRARISAHEFEASASGDMSARMPEIVAQHESAARLEVEVLRLEAERRGLVAMREVAAHSVASLQAVMDQIETRPAYIATTQRMDVAFVTYQQIDGVSAGRAVYQCTAGIFFCHEVGRIRSVLPGEIVTQDPWGELARGRYAVLDLDEPDAVQERILRVR